MDSNAPPKLPEHVQHRLDMDHERFPAKTSEELSNDMQAHEARHKLHLEDIQAAGRGEGDKAKYVAEQHKHSQLMEKKASVEGGQRELDELNKRLEEANAKEAELKRKLDSMGQGQ